MLLVASCCGVNLLCSLCDVEGPNAHNAAEKSEI